jgi:hypothetical protein
MLEVGICLGSFVSPEVGARIRHNHEGKPISMRSSTIHIQSAHCRKTHLQALLHSRDPLSMVQASDDWISMQLLH